MRLMDSQQELMIFDVVKGSHPEKKSEVEMYNSLELISKAAYDDNRRTFEANKKMMLNRIAQHRRNNSHYHGGQ